MSRRKLTSLALFGAVTTLAPAALAADPPCDPTTYTCVIANASAPVKLAKSLTEVQFDNKLDSGWIGCGGAKTGCKAAPNQNCNLGACVEADMGDSKIDISMQSFFDVSWVEPGKVKVVPRPKSNTGSLKVTYTLTPLIGIHIDVAGFKGTVALNPTDILAVLGVPDVTKGFQSPASCASVFDPFQFGAPASKCHAEGFNDVFAIPLSDLTGLFGLDLGEYIKLDLKLQAGTKTDFTWQTTDVQMDTLSPKITSSNPSGYVQYSGEDELDLNVWATGILGYTGSTEIKPALTVKEVAGFPVNLSISIPVGAEVPFMGQVPGIQLTKTSVNIPLPNILVNTQGIAFGSVALGSSATKTLKLQNTGKLLLKASISSTDGAYSFDKTKIDVPARVDATPGSYDLKITFIPKKGGDAPATLKIASNDVDEPLIEIPLSGLGDGTSSGAGGSGTGPGAGGSAPAAGSSVGTSGSGGSGKSNPTVQNEDTGEAGGCHCTAAADDTSPLALAALGALGLFIGLRRRSR